MDFDAHLQSESHQNILAIFVHQLQSKRTSSSLSRTTADADNQQIQNLLETLIGGVEVLTNDLIRLKNECRVESSHLSALGQQLRQSEEELKDKDQSIERVRFDEEIIENELPFIREQVHARLATHHEGKFIWKIDNLQQKIGQSMKRNEQQPCTYFFSSLADAESDRQTSIYSPVFYTSPTGYKLRLRLYLTGDAGARRTHLSLFLVLMRGEFDAILRFPFCYKVIFSLLDQSEAKNHLVGFFQPDPTSSSFHRPRTEMNTASGLSKFVPLPVLHDTNNRYIVNDTMFIEAKIDFEHLFLSSSSSSPLR